MPRSGGFPEVVLGLLNGGEQPYLDDVVALILLVAVTSEVVPESIIAFPPKGLSRWPEPIVAIKDRLPQGN